MALLRLLPGVRREMLSMVRRKVIRRCAREHLKLCAPVLSLNQNRQRIEQTEPGERVRATRARSARARISAGWCGEGSSKPEGTMWWTCRQF